MELAVTKGIRDSRNGGDQSLSQVGFSELPLDNGKGTKLGRNISQEDEPSDHKPVRRNISLKNWILAFLGCLMVLVWLLSDCLPSVGLEEKERPSRSSRLVKNAVGALAATATITNDFQVYQPVLTPSVTTGAIAVSTGEDNTTTVVSTSGAVCEVLLMKYTFGNSYGAPFVGKMELFCHCQS